MARISAISIHDDLTPCQSGISVRSADNETSCRIDVKSRLFIDQFHRQHRVEHLFLNVFMDLFLGHILVMLGGKHYRLQAQGLAFRIIFHRNLTLAVGTQIF